MRPSTDLHERDTLDLREALLTAAIVFVPVLGLLLGALAVTP